MITTALYGLKNLQIRTRNEDLKLNENENPESELPADVR